MDSIKQKELTEKLFNDGILRKITTPYPKICFSPNHTHPFGLILEDGDYEYTCPDCGRKYIFSTW